MAGEQPEIDIQDVIINIKENVDGIIDEGKSRIGKPSTIIKVENEEILILREGPITKVEIENKIKN